jgi:hypothetical protein
MVIARISRQVDHTYVHFRHAIVRACFEKSFGGVGGDSCHVQGRTRSALQFTTYVDALDNIPNVQNVDFKKEKYMCDHECLVVQIDEVDKDSAEVVDGSGDGGAAAETYRCKLI